MYIIKCFWAGQLVSIFEVERDMEITEKIAELQERLKSKKITHVSCWHTFVLTELCIDVMKDKKLIATHNLKA